ncbi:MAG: glycosyltransferase [Eubacteriales bacterium]
MKLSIIVPVYNMVADGKLEYCLESLVNQTLDDYEIIAVDDCSTDNSLEVLKKYEKQYEGKFHAVHSPVNQKQGGAKNIGLSLAKGEWIGFIDSDDWITADMYERMIHKAEETGADMVACDYQIVYEHSMKPGKQVANHTFDQTGVLDESKYKKLIMNTGSLVIKIYKREQLEQHNIVFPEHIFYEDNAVSNSFVLQATHFEYINEPLYYYYQHDTSTVHTITKQRCEDRMVAARMMIEEAKKKQYLEQYYEEIEYKFAVLFYVNTLFSYIVSKDRRSLSFMSAMAKEMKETFPNFQENAYYKNKVDKEQQKMIKVQMKSTLAFMLYYDLLFFYRKLRYKK